MRGYHFENCWSSPASCVGQQFVTRSNRRRLRSGGDEVGVIGHPSGIELLDVGLGMLCETHPMAWILTVPDGDWVDGGGSLAELHAEVVDPVHSRVDHIMAVHSLNPRGLSAHLGLYTSAMAGTSTLRKVERELIALVVSLENHCHY